MAKYTEEELKAKAEEMTKEIIDVLTKHSPLPARAFLFALVACIEVIADSIEEGGGPSAEETMNRFIEYTEACFAACNKNNA